MSEIRPPVAQVRNQYTSQTRRKDEDRRITRHRPNPLRKDPAFRLRIRGYVQQHRIKEFPLGKQLRPMLGRGFQPVENHLLLRNRCLSVEKSVQ